MTSRRGFTLIELLVSMVLMLIVSGSIYRLLNTTQRISRAQAARVDMQSNMRAGTLILPAELREVGYDTMPGTAGNTNVPDIQMATGDSIRFRAVRGSGIICSVAGTTITISTAAAYSGLRSMATTDSLLIFVDGDPTTTADDRWVARGISSISAASTTACPAGWLGTWPRDGFTITIPNWTANNVIVGASTTVNDVVASTSVTTGSPIKFFEIMRYGIYSSGGKNLLGAEALNSGGARQPVLGPLAANGFHLTYYDSTGAQITPRAQDVRSRIRTIRISMIGTSDENVSSSGTGGARQVLDSVVTTVALRNSLAR
jgi:prepilin-type N-terminal cleavage/methylation domain-containing protein